MKRDVQYLLDILEAARLAIGYLEGKSLAEFMDDSLLQDAVIRRIEIIGEAAKRVSDETRKKHNDLPWREMSGMRNVVIHEYDAVDFGIVWDTVKSELSALVESLQDIVPPPPKA